MTSSPFRLLIFALLAALPLLTASASVRLAPAFGDHMVLQQGRPVPVWGTAAPGQKVTVAFASQQVAALADAEGRWRVELAALGASAEARTLLVSGADAPADRAEANDVLVGEVWLGSGQSNMQMTADGYIPGAPTREPTDPKPNDQNLLKLLDGAPYPTVRLVCTTYKNNSVRPERIEWQTASRENLLQFSAQLQSFGVPLSQRLNVPVGLILIAVGGSPSGRWIDPAAIRADPHVAPLIAGAAAKFSRADEEAKYAAALAKYEAEFAIWNLLPDAEKKTVKAPGKPAAVVAPGEGMRWPVGDLHDNVLSPFIGYGLRGVLWDQGESGSMVRAVDQFAAMQALIASWRREWGQRDLPFCVVQKPSGGGCAFDPADPVFGWATDSFEPLPERVAGDGRSREINQNLATIPGVFLVPTADLGSGLHPLNKFAYGARGLQVALTRVYGQSGPSSGPVFRSAEVLADRIRVTFDHTDGGLCFRQGDRLQGFAVAGADKKFVWADACIEGETVIVSSPKVPAPQFVRYAWDPNPRWANLFNGSGLPALTFRTDP